MAENTEIVFHTTFGAFVYSAITLYMMALLLRWLAPFLSLNMQGKPCIWLTPITDPYLKLIRNTLPSMGFTDWSPLAGVLILWLIRTFLVSI
ncbi:MAG: YggT family protein [Candidatus Hydrogenedens sp.]|jgi:uncharacterized protein YggT (Ycf19 family)|nr:YggT family protein [Candidatus Hydrogenedens sp.]